MNLNVNHPSLVDKQNNFFVPAKTKSEMEVDQPLQTKSLDVELKELSRISWSAENVSPVSICVATQGKV